MHESSIKQQQLIILVRFGLVSSFDFASSFDFKDFFLLCRCTKYGTILL